MKLTLGQIADWIHAEGEFDDDAVAEGYSIDTRTIAAGELFFAVKGEVVDGHDFVEKAIANGAVAAVVSQHWLTPPELEAKVLRVPDDCDDCVLNAMQKLAHAVRKHWGKRVVGITGSAGKTTTKECVAAVLAAKFRVLKTEGNYNNHLGVPLTLMRLEPEHEVAVVEMGMNHAGEISLLAKIAAPNWGVVSNVGMAHTEFFADGIDGVARAKRELIEELPADGVAFLNADDERVRRFGDGLSLKVVLYGTSDDAEVRATDVLERGLFGTDFIRRAPGLLESQTRWPVHLYLPGRHNVLNALAAFAVGREAGVELADAVAAIERLRPTEKRGNTLQFNGAMIVNDTYNSNPAALQAMIKALASSESARRILVAGEMRELGPEGESLHRACGKAAAAAGIDVVIGVTGMAQALVEEASAQGVVAQFVATPAEAGAWLKANLRAGDVAVLKASRGVKLEGALVGWV
ncbi:UDP-N-acetylmuramoyl-tripeptide--D-alanyl-D-alanine ligase [Granulicella cerasi]|uniref:UDP-N-acetylmuramoyl-tripeptide--D-alanyl-D-alanine ligase n=1 Tax=Granulicella cerasi TaxID=741063 RepID=A0ABW1ZC04_9BACT|nr:UDP-N-acetylmuramoyl-tripeptide--D-alanyl-D-alanine ligase [Granulicella cerasi]